jgi:gluconokinase
MTAFVFMGVSGAGKSTLGKRVSRELSLPFVEGDQFHPAANVAKMSGGVPLTDADREPWIDALGDALNRRADGDVILACSALTGRIRERLRGRTRAPVEFLFLTAPPEVIEQRLRNRPHHFMKAGMLGSQLAALEPPQDAHVVDVSGPIDSVAAQAVAYIRQIQRRTRAL